MKTAVFIAFGFILALSSWVSAQPTKEELVTRPRYMKGALEPVFKAVDSEVVRNDTKIVSGRNTAVIGFNTPEVVVYLPRIDNSAYAIVTFDEPRLVNDKGASVPFELEGGGYDDDTFSNEIRLAHKDGTGLVTYGRVRGSGRIKYPLAVKTRIVKKGAADAKGPDITLDGSFVTYIDSNLPDMVFLSTRVGPVRAYDVKGRRLEEHSYHRTSTQGDVTQRTLAFWGDVAEIQIDTVTHWSDIEFTYDLPPIKSLSENYVGKPMSRPPNIVETPGGIVDIKIAKITEIKASEKSDRTRKSENSSAKQEKKDFAKSEEMEFADDVVDRFFLSIIEGDMETVAGFLDAGMSPNVKRPGFGHSPLFTSIMGHQDDMAMMFIELGGDVNFKDENQSTPLMWAVGNCKSVPLVKALVKAGADVNATAKGGGRPLESAKVFKCNEIVKILKKAGAK